MDLMILAALKLVPVTTDEQWDRYARRVWRMEAQMQHRQDQDDDAYMRAQERLRRRLLPQIKRARKIVGRNTRCGWL